MAGESAVRLGSGAVEPLEPWDFEDSEPASGVALAALVGGGRADAVRAVDHAAAALTLWVNASSSRRAQSLQAVANQLRSEATRADLAPLIAQETGKCLSEAESEVDLAAAFFDWFGAACACQHDELWEIVPGVGHEVRHHALGVVAVLTPWNFPVSIPARKIAAALGAGCSVVFKPSDVAPLSSLRFAEVVERCVPRDVICTVIGDPKVVVGAWLGDPRVRGVTFTGSPTVGQSVAGACVTKMKRCVLELGGNAPYLVLDDADLGQAVATLMVAKYRNNGQSCIAANHAWVPRRHYGAFVDAFVAATRELVLGNPLDTATTLGPLALSSDPARMGALVADARLAGAAIVRTHDTTPLPGNFCGPAICLSPELDCRVITEEIFGPVISILPYDDLGRTVATINELHYGLSGYVATRDVVRGRELARALDLGIVGINIATPNTPQVPFGGRRGSGLGVEGGQLGLHEFLSHQVTAYRFPAGGSMGERPAGKQTRAGCTM